MDQVPSRSIQEFINDEVDIIDVGGVSTKPGADDVSIAEELNRILPVLETTLCQKEASDQTFI